MNRPSVFTAFLVLIRCFVTVADISSDIQFIPDGNEFEMDVNNYDVTKNSIRCLYEVSNTSSIIWFKDGAKVQITQTGGAPVFQQSITVNEAGLYFLTHAQVTDSGNYTCKVTVESDEGTRNVSVCIVDTSTTSVADTTVFLSTTAFQETSTPHMETSTVYNTTVYTTSSSYSTEESTTQQITSIQETSSPLSTHISISTAVETTQPVFSTIESTTSSQTNDNTTAIIAGSVVAVLLVILAIVVIICCRRKEKTPKQETTNGGNDMESAVTSKNIENDSGTFADKAYEDDDDSDSDILEDETTSNSNSSQSSY